MSRTPNPYSSLPAKAFWRPAVAERHFADMEELALRIPLSMQDRLATAGSCFAQHIGRNLKNSGPNYQDFEPAPPQLSAEEAKRHGFGLYSCRYGNIYTVRQLRQLVEEAFGERSPAEIVWSKDGRFYDALRPGVDPVGHESEERVLALRRTHLLAVRRMLESTDVFVFTLGLTEAWCFRQDGTVFPTAPGTGSGVWDAERYEFKNFRYREIYEDMAWFHQRLKSLNPHARLVMTVSPVPLTATASGEHVLTSTIYSKSTLRAVAGDLAQDLRDAYYFPSYELVAGHPTRGAFFNPDLRTVNDFGVRCVMQAFFKCVGFDTAGLHRPEPEEDAGVICDEEKLEKEFSARPA